MSEAFSIDHVHVYVSDRKRAQDWYRDVVGLEPVSRLRSWATEHGPLMLSGDSGKTMIALFQKDPTEPPARTPLAAVAFRTNAKGFKEFLKTIEQLPVYDEHGRRVTGNDVVDHRLAKSIYFCDADGNRFELTTYEVGA